MIVEGIKIDSGGDYCHNAWGHVQNRNSNSKERDWTYSSHKLEGIVHNKTWR